MAPKDMVSVIHEGKTVHKEMMLASKEAVEKKSHVSLEMLKKFLVSEWDLQMVMQAMLWNMVFKDSRSRSSSPPSKSKKRV